MAGHAPEGRGVMGGVPPTFAADWPDRTKRAWEQLRLHIDAIGDDAVGRWIALRLSDGGSDGVLYDSKPDAVRHQLHEHQCAYLLIHPFDAMTRGELHRFLAVCEQIYDGGGRLQDEGTYVNPNARGLTIV